MKKINQRQKQPEALRTLLLEKTEEIVLDRGVSGLTLDAVAKAAGVSKGGLLHHFPNKQFLIEESFRFLLAQYSQEIKKFTESDPDQFGKFTRAYISIVTQAEKSEGGRLLGLYTLGMNTEPNLREIWTKWIAEQEELYGESSPSVGCCIARVAADGIWLAILSQSLSIPERFREAVIEKMYDMTRE